MELFSAGLLQSRNGTGKARQLVHNMIHDPEGPLWYRGYVNSRESMFCPALGSIMARFGVRQVVVGHNVMPGGKARVLCGEQLYMMDVGMSQAYLGAPSTVWKCDGGHIEILQNII
jgi:hypothetical protein